MRQAFSAVVMAVLALDTLGGGRLARADTPPPDQIEEDWVLVITSPDLGSAGPQVTTSMSPTGNFESNPYVVFNLNYRDQPTFFPGGLQVQVWSGKQLGKTASLASSPCNTANETITWTQRMSLSGGRITYTISKGESTTWGQFGEGAKLNVDFAAPADSLAGYSPAASASRSGVGWQSNRVGSMKLVQVRYYASSNLIETDSTERSIPLTK